MLSVYRYLQRVAGAMDRMILERGLHCTNLLGQNYFNNNVYSVTQKLIDLSQRKVTLINLKILVEETLGTIGCENAQILIEKYFDGVKAREMTQIHSKSMRTIFRKIDSAVEAFACKLLSKGYTDEKLHNMLEKETWILNVYRQFSTKKEEEISFSNAYIEKAASI